MLLQHLRQHYELVVNTLSLLSLFHAMCGEIEKVLTFNCINMGLRTKGFEGIRELAGKYGKFARIDDRARSSDTHRELRSRRCAVAQVRLGAEEG